ncbi:hypothetical protein JYG38_22345 [Pseudomonas rhodesiae]|jgi:hypothetical protein|uniref:hypothetical protein n=1 Tax=Pseudomonas rhodesiae TaxID=76760 RepID=UPI001BCBC433|nr:hypothetical protein [Pseudomonas rhodesiae]QVN00916.1 hypothetical protein JYG38_22345 [Pseudomonas rhodesiae]
MDDIETKDNRMGSPVKSGKLNFFDISTDNLRKEFSLQELSNKIESLVPPDSGFKEVSSWEEFESIRGMLRFLADYKERTESEYFISPQAEQIYNLVKLQGEAQQKALGITVGLYKNNAKAKAWWRKLSSTVHPDRCKHSGATSATEELNRLYKEMTGNG